MVCPHVQLDEIWRDEIEIPSLSPACLSNTKAMRGRRGSKADWTSNVDKIIEKYIT